MFQIGQLHIKNLAASAVRFLKYVWPYWDNSKGVNIINGQNLLDYLLLTLIKFLNSIWFFLGAFVLFICSGFPCKIIVQYLNFAATVYSANILC